MIAHTPPPEPVVAEQLRLQPLYERSARLLGLLAGILLLATAGRDPAPQRRHLPALRAQYAATCAAYRDLVPARHLRATFGSIGTALDQIGAALGELDSAAAPPLLFAHLQAARRALQQGSRPTLGLTPVDITTACCAGHGAIGSNQPSPSHCFAIGPSLSRLEARERGFGGRPAELPLPHFEAGEGRGEGHRARSSRGIPMPDSMQSR
jgi:hypothetical protein